MFATSLLLLSRIQSYKVTLLSAVSYYSARTSTHKYSAWHLSISTPAEIKKYLSKVQVLLNVYLNTIAHVLGPMPAEMQ